MVPCGCGYSIATIIMVHCGCGPIIAILCTRGNIFSTTSYSLYMEFRRSSIVCTHLDSIYVGLAVLSESELRVMCQEMEAKFSRLSESLVADLQFRDKLVTELSVKNKFITAMLRVKSLKHSSSVASSGDALARPRSKSMRSKVAEDRINGKVRIAYIKVLSIKLSCCFLALIGSIYSQLFLITLLKIVLGV